MLWKPTQWSAQRTGSFATPIALTVPKIKDVANMSNVWYQSRFTGLFRDFERVAPRPHDPQVSVCAGIVPHLHPEQNGELHVGGCGWSDEAAANACAGEAIERLFAYPPDQDATIESSYEDWPFDEPAIAPD